jgi:hypothetical protein
MVYPAGAAICASGVGRGAAVVGFWATAKLVIINKMATPMPSALRRSIALEGCCLNSREIQPMFFI